MHKGGGAASASDANFRAPRATCAVELAPLREQLLRDMQHWRPRAITPKMLGDLRRKKRDDPVRASLMIVNRTVYYQRPVGYPRSPVLTAIIHDLQELADTFPAVEDTEFVLNVDDYPFVPLSGRKAAATAPLPLFSHYQTRHHGDVLCPGGSFREGSYDRLMLRGRRHYESAFPWASKVAQGFWQGHPYCGRHRFGRCSRYLLSHLSAQLLERNRSALLNVGMTFYEEKLDQHLKSAACGCKQGWAHPGDLPRPATPLTKRPWVRIEHHARYRYLLQLDGHTCSWRFQYLLATNSPVLKQSSYFWEFYYGALAPGVHYVPFWTTSATDVLDVLANVSHPSSDARMRRVARAGQAFVHRHLNAHARQCYWRALLALYTKRLREPPRLGDWPAAQRANMRGCRGPDPRLGPNPASEPHSPTTCSREGWFRGAKAEAHVDWSATREAWRRKDDASLRRFVDGIEAELDGLAAGGAVFTSTMDKRNAEFDP